MSLIQPPAELWPHNQILRRCWRRWGMFNSGAPKCKAESSYLNALAADPKEVRAYLGLARMYQAYSLYRHAYQQLERAHQIAPNDPDGGAPLVRTTLPPGAYRSHRGLSRRPHPDDPEETRALRRELEFLKATANKPVHACKLTSKVEQTDTSLETMRRDPQHVVGTGLVVKLNDRNNRLILDTGASGILIGRKAAEKSGLAPIAQTNMAGSAKKVCRGAISPLPIAFA